MKINSVLYYRCGRHFFHVYHNMIFGEGGSNILYVALCLECFSRRNFIPPDMASARSHSIALVFLIFPRVLCNSRGRFLRLVNPMYSISSKCRSRLPNFIRQVIYSSDIPAGHVYHCCILHFIIWIRRPQEKFLC